MAYRIIIHDGKAHIDELLGAALLALHLGEEPESIERIDSQEAAEIVRRGGYSENTWFIDCGLVYDRGRRLFDHHQERETDSAALLIFNEFFPHLQGTDLHSYMQLVSKVDTQGAMSLDDFETANESREYLYFSQGIVLKAFADDPLPILRIFMAGLEDKINFEQAKAEAAQWLEVGGHVEIVKVGGLNVLRYLVKPPSAMTAPLRSAMGSMIDENDVAAILSFDDKQPEVRTLYRTDFGHELVDFSKCRPADVVFCHPGGFLLKFKPSDEDEWRMLVEQAIN